MNRFITTILIAVGSGFVARFPGGQKPEFESMWPT